MVDFAPGGASPMQRVNSLDYAVVIEGVFRMILDSGEERTLHRGDIVVQQSTAHRWVNVTGNGLLPARILVVPLNINDLHPGGEKMQRKLGLPRRDSVLEPSHKTEDGPDRGRFAKFRENDYWESEF
jgi:Cupin domain